MPFIQPGLYNYVCSFPFLKIRHLPLQRCLKPLVGHAGPRQYTLLLNKPRRGNNQVISQSLSVSTSNNSGTSKTMAKALRPRQTLINFFCAARTSGCIICSSCFRASALPKTCLPRAADLLRPQRPRHQTHH